MIRSLALAAALLFSTSWYHVTVQIPGKKPSGVTIEKNAPMFLFGLAGAEVPAPCDAAIVETQRGIIDWFLGSLTLGLYTPYTVTFTCSDDRSDDE